MPDQTRARRIDLIVVSILAAFTILYASLAVPFDIPPFEDAAMLMRYTDHVANGHGMVWNIGERPVDGATDFLFVLTSAVLVFLGSPVGRAVRALGAVSHVLAVVLVYAVNRRVWHGSVLASAFSAAYLAVGTGLAYVAAYFGTPFFALAAAVTWALALWQIGQDAEERWVSIAFSLGGLVTALIRPEGAILALLMLLSIVLVRGAGNSRQTILAFALVFLVLGGAYFWWRWQYFGYPLPNPFYKKGGGFHSDSFQGSLLTVLRFGLPFVPAFIVGLRERSQRIRTAAFLLPVVGFAVCFALISDETNYGGRFQYAVLPLILMSWIPLVQRWKFSTDAAKEVASHCTIAAAVGFTLAALLYYSWSQNCHLTSFQRSCGAPYEADGRFDLGRLLSNYRGRGYVLATTEAGLLPYYSGWTAIDTWGLNDSRIAHEGDVTAAYLDQYKPHVIAFHAYFSPLVPPKLTKQNLEQDWFRMTITLKDYAEARGYVLAAAFGDSPYDTTYYYVRPDFEDSQKITNLISGMERYYWFTTGKRSINYAALERP